MHSLMTRVARWMALLGGVVLLVLVLLTCVSVVGRSLNTIGHMDILKNNAEFLAGIFQNFKPIPGDFEIIETGIAFAILAFFPWCSINRGHATVDIFTAGFSDRMNRFLAFFWETVFFAVMVLITWRLYVGMLDKIRYGEVSFLLEVPVWWGFAICAFASSVAAIVAGYSAYCRFAEVRRGVDAGPAGGGIGH